MCKTDLFFTITVMAFTDKAKKCAISPRLLIIIFGGSYAVWLLQIWRQSKWLWKLTACTSKQLLILHQWVSFHSYSLLLCSSLSFIPLSKSVYYPEENKEGIGLLPRADGAMLTDYTWKAELHSSDLPFTFSSRALQTKQHKINTIKRKLKHKAMKNLVREIQTDINNFMSLDTRQ